MRILPSRKIAYGEYFPSLRTIGTGIDYRPNHVFTERHRVVIEDVALFSFVTRGRATVYIDDKRYDDGPGAVAIVAPGQALDTVTDRRGIDYFSIPINFSRFSLHTFPEKLRAVIPTLCPLRKEFAHRVMPYVHLQLPQTQMLTELLKTARQELMAKGTGYEFLVHRSVEIFLAYCCRAALEGGFRRSSSEAPILQNIVAARAYLDQNYTKPVTLESCAHAAGLAPTYLCRLFKEHVGKSVFTYLVERRIQSAMVSLLATKEKIVNIALESGFNSLPHFNRMFRKTVGCSPSEYRERASEWSQNEYDTR